MNIKLPSEEKAKQSQVRRPRHQTRNGPNSKLLNAAWPKAPTVPTRQSHIKAVNHSEFQQSWSKWKQQVGNTTLGESIEDMEIDEDCPANKKQVDTASKDEKKASNNHTLTRPAIRGSRRNQRKTEETHEEKSSSSIITSEDCEVSSTSDLHVAIKKKTPQKAKDALFIIIHVSQVEVGVIKGPATAPVKVFADKFMVQMENEVTKKDLSFRVPCKNILSLHLDVYSFGVLFCEMCTRELPVPENRIEQIRNVGNTEYRNLINNCLRRDIDKRLDSRAVADVIQSWVMSELEIKQSTVI